MQKWECMFVRGLWTGDTVRAAKPFQVNGQKLADWEAGPTMYEYANQLGEQGWELVTIEIGDQWNLVLKRPKV